MKISDYVSEAIKWNPSGDAKFPYTTMLDGKTARIRLNDFPADILYTLIVGDAEFDLDEWPTAWIKTNAKNIPRSNGSPRGRLVKAI
jgi:hypothetical protein